MATHGYATAPGCLNSLTPPGGSCNGNCSNCPPVGGCECYINTGVNVFNRVVDKLGIKKQKCRYCLWKDRICQFSGAGGGYPQQTYVGYSVPAPVQGNFGHNQGGYPPPGSPAYNPSFQSPPPHATFDSMTGSYGASTGYPPPSNMAQGGYSEPQQPFAYGQPNPPGGYGAYGQPPADPYMQQGYPGPHTPQTQGSGSIGSHPQSFPSITSTPATSTADYGGQHSAYVTLGGAPPGPSETLY